MIRREWFPYASKKALKWINRMELFKVQFSQLDCDVYCFQEVDLDYVPSFWEPLFREKGFTVKLLVKRRKSRHGLMIAYREALFEELVYRGLQCEDLRLDARDVFDYIDTDQPNSVQILALAFKKQSEEPAAEGKSKVEGRDKSEVDGIVVTNTHLCWRYQLGYTKLRQAHYLLSALNVTIESLLPQRFIPVMMGDWNCTQNTLPYCVMRTRSLPAPFPLKVSHSCYWELRRQLLTDETSETLQRDQIAGPRQCDAVLLQALKDKKLPFPALHLSLLSSSALDEAIRILSEQDLSSLIPQLPESLKAIFTEEACESDVAQMYLPMLSTDALPATAAAASEEIQRPGFLASDFFRACALPGVLRLSEFADEYIRLLPRSWQIQLETDVELFGVAMQQEACSRSPLSLWRWPSSDLKRSELASPQEAYKAAQAWYSEISAAEQTIVDSDAWKEKLAKAQELALKTKIRAQAVLSDQLKVDHALPSLDSEVNDKLSQAAAEMVEAEERIKELRKAKTAAEATPDQIIPEEVLTALEQVQRPDPKLAADVMTQRMIDVCVLVNDIKNMKHIPPLTSAYHWYKHCYSGMPTAAIRETEVQGSESKVDRQCCPCYPICNKITEVHHDGPSFTTFTGTFAGALDCIYVPRSGVDVAAIAELPLRTQVDRSFGLPDEAYPSDHLQIAAQLDI